ncbi:hypothetical protein AC1031_018610 [Aphanomyces cochlioides]|nr:hypothetical protein AC1031_018610 [Aphanomyces cochlioides]
MWWPVYVCDPRTIRSSIYELGTGELKIARFNPLLPLHNRIVYYFGAYEFGLFENDSKMKSWSCSDYRTFIKDQTKFLDIKNNVVKKFEEALKQVQEFRTAQDDGKRLLLCSMLAHESSTQLPQLFTYIDGKEVPSNDRNTHTIMRLFRVCTFDSMQAALSAQKSGNKMKAFRLVQDNGVMHSLNFAINKARFPIIKKSKDSTRELPPQLPPLKPPRIFSVEEELLISSKVKDVLNEMITQITSDCEQIVHDTFSESQSTSDIDTDNKCLESNENSIARDVFCVMNDIISTIESLNDFNYCVTQNSASQLWSGQENDHNTNAHETSECCLAYDTIAWARRCEKHPWWPVFVCDPRILRSSLYHLGDAHRPLLLKARKHQRCLHLVYYFGRHKFGLTCLQLKKWKTMSPETMQSQFSRSGFSIDLFSDAIAEAQRCQDSSNPRSELPFLASWDFDLTYSPLKYQRLEVQYHNVFWTYESNAWWPVYICDPEKVRSDLDKLGGECTKYSRIAKYLPKDYVIVFFFGTHHFGLKRRHDLTKDLNDFHHDNLISIHLNNDDNRGAPLKRAVEEAKAFLADLYGSQTMPKMTPLDIDSVSSNLDKPGGETRRSFSDKSHLEGFWRAVKDEEARSERKVSELELHRKRVELLFQDLMDHDYVNDASSSDDESDSNDDSEEPESCDTEWERSDSESHNKRQPKELKQFAKISGTVSNTSPTKRRPLNKKTGGGTKRTAHIWKHFTRLDHLGKYYNQHYIECTHCRTAYDGRGDKNIPAPKVMISQIPAMKRHLLKCNYVQISEEELSIPQNDKTPTTEPIFKSLALPVLRSQSQTPDSTIAKCSTTLEPKHDIVNILVESGKSSYPLSPVQIGTSTQVSFAESLISEQQVRSLPNSPPQSSPPINLTSDSKKKATSSTLDEKIRRNHADIIVLDDDEYDPISNDEMANENSPEQREKPAEVASPMPSSIKTTSKLRVPFDSLAWAFLKGYPWLPVYVLDPLRVKRSLHLLGNRHEAILKRAQQNPIKYCFVYYFGTHNFGLHTNPLQSVKPWKCAEHATFLKGYPKSSCKGKSVVNELLEAICEAEKFECVPKASRILPYMVPSDTNPELIPPPILPVPVHALGWALSQGYPWMPIFVCDPHRLRSSLFNLGNKHRFDLEKAKLSPTSRLVFYFGSHTFGLRKTDGTIKPWDCPEREMHMEVGSNPILYVKKEIMEQFKDAMKEVEEFLSVDEENRLLPEMVASDMNPFIEPPQKYTSGEFEVGNDYEELTNAFSKRRKTAESDKSVASGKSRRDTCFRYLAWFHWNEMLWWPVFICSSRPIEQDDWGGNSPCDFSTKPVLIFHFGTHEFGKHSSAILKPWCCPEHNEFASCTTWPTSAKHLREHLSLGLQEANRFFEGYQQSGVFPYELLPRNIIAKTTQMPLLDKTAAQNVPEVFDAVHETNVLLRGNDVTCDSNYNLRSENEESGRAHQLQDAHQCENSTARNSNGKESSSPKGDNVVVGRPLTVKDSESKPGVDNNGQMDHDLVIGAIQTSDSSQVIVIDDSDDASGSMIDEEADGNQNDSRTTRKRTRNVTKRTLNRRKPIPRATKRKLSTENIKLPLDYMEQVDEKDGAEFEGALNDDRNVVNVDKPTQSPMQSDDEGRLHIHNVDEENQSENNAEESSDTDGGFDTEIDDEVSSVESNIDIDDVSELSEAISIDDNLQDADNENVIEDCSSDDDDNDDEDLENIEGGSSLNRYGLNHTASVEDIKEQDISNSDGLHHEAVFGRRQQDSNSDLDGDISLNGASQENSQNTVSFEAENEVNLPQTISTTEMQLQLPLHKAIPVEEQGSKQAHKKKVPLGNGRKNQNKTSPLPFRQTRHRQLITLEDSEEETPSDPPRLKKKRNQPQKSVAKRRRESVSTDESTDNSPHRQRRPKRRWSTRIFEVIEID